MTSVNINPENVEPTIKRIELFLEDQDWNKVKEYTEAALDYFPTDYRLYIFLLCAEMKATSVSDLKNCKDPILESEQYKKVLRFCDAETAHEFKLAAGVFDALERRYQSGIEASEAGNYQLAAQWFESAYDYKDAEQKKEQMQGCVEKLRRANDFVADFEKIYATAKNSNETKVEGILKKHFPTQKEFSLCEKELKQASKGSAIETIINSNGQFEVLYDSLPDVICADLDKQKEKKEYAEKEKLYNKAVSLSNKESLGDLLVAKRLFEGLAGFKGSEQRANEVVERMNRIKDSQYSHAENLFSSENETDINTAITIMKSLGSYKDAAIRSEEFEKALEYSQIYNLAITKKEKGGVPDLQLAQKMFGQIVGFKDSESLMLECESALNEVLKKQSEESAKKKRTKRIAAFIIIILLVGGVVTGIVISNNNKAAAYNQALNYYRQGKYEQALAAFDELGNYKDASDYKAKTQNAIKEEEERKAEEERLKDTYNEGVDYYNNGQYDEAIATLSPLGDYGDSKGIIEKSENALKVLEEVKRLVEEEGKLHEAANLIETNRLGMGRRKNSIIGQTYDFLYKYGAYEGVFELDTDTSHIHNTYPYISGWEERVDNAITRGGESVKTITLTLQGLRYDENYNPEATYKNYGSTPDLVVTYDGGEVLFERHETFVTNSDWHYYLHDNGEHSAELTVEDQKIIDEDWTEEDGEAVIVFWTDSSHNSHITRYVRKE